MRIGIRSPHSFIHLVVFFLLCVVLTACPPVTKKRAVKKPKSRQEEVQKPVTRPAAPSRAITPQRRASERLVEKGVLEMNAKNYEQAAQLFQDAVNVDASNGVAYYYLASADANLGQQDTAFGLLDKAESLLRDDRYWMDRIEELRASISGEKPSAIKPPPVFDQY